MSRRLPGSNEKLAVQGGRQDVERSEVWSLNDERLLILSNNIKVVLWIFRSVVLFSGFARRCKITRNSRHRFRKPTCCCVALFRLSNPEPNQYRFELTTKVSASDEHSEILFISFRTLEALMIVMEACPDLFACTLSQNTTRGSSRIDPSQNCNSRLLIHLYRILLLFTVTYSYSNTCNDEKPDVVAPSTANQRLIQLNACCG